MTVPEKLTVAGPEDVLGFIPHSLGYWPEASLVVITMHGKRLGATLRLDLPKGAVLASPARYLRMVRGYLAADKEADGTLLAFFTGDAAAAAAKTYGSLLAVLDSTLQTTMPVRAAWYVGVDYWREAYCADTACCPFPGRPLQEILDSPLNAEMVYRGSSVGPPPEHQRAVRAVPGLHRAAVLEAQEAWAEQLGSRRGSRAQLRAVLDAWELVLGRPEGPWLPEAERDGFLRASLLVPGWRDAVLVMAAAGKDAAEAGAAQFGIVRDGCEPPPLAPPAAWAAALAGDAAYAEGAAGQSWPPGSGASGSRRAAAGEDGSSAVAGPGYADVLMGVQPSVPDWAGLNALDLVLEELAVVGGSAAAAAMTLRGWISWCRGRGSYAAAYFQQALEIEPGYRLAELLLELVGRGAICGWAGRKEAAWQKFQG